MKPMMSSVPFEVALLPPRTNEPVRSSSVPAVVQLVQVTEMPGGMTRPSASAVAEFDDGRTCVSRSWKPTFWTMLVAVDCPVDAGVGKGILVVGVRMVVEETWMLDVKADDAVVAMSSSLERSDLLFARCLCGRKVYSWPWSRPKSTFME